MSAAYFGFCACLFAMCFLPDVTKVKKKQQQTPSSATVMELVSTKRQGVTKQVKRLQGRLGPGKSKATVKDKRIKSAVGQSACCISVVFYSKHEEICEKVKTIGTEAFAFLCKDQ